MSNVLKVADRASGRKALSSEAAVSEAAVSGAAVSGAAVSEVGVSRVDTRSQGDRFRLAGREEMKYLAKAEALVVESERCVARQAFLITELRGDGLATLEAEKSLTRLEAVVLEQRANRDVARRKAQDISELGV